MLRLTKKFETASQMLPQADVSQIKIPADIALIYFGTTAHPINESIDQLKEHGLSADTLRIKAFPFNHQLVKFINEHNEIFVIEQNRDAQMRTVISTELQIDPNRLNPITNYDGLPITSKFIVQGILNKLTSKVLTEQVS